MFRKIHSLLLSYAKACAIQRELRIKGVVRSLRYFLLYSRLVVDIPVLTGTCTVHMSESTRVLVVSKEAIHS